MSTPPTSTPWVPINPPKAVPNIVPTPVDGKWATSASGAMVWQDLPVTPPLAGVVTPDTAWHIIGAAGEIQFQNGWREWTDANYNPCRYRKLLDGLVIFNGLLRPGTQNLAAFTMPVGWRITGQVAGGQRIMHRVTAQSPQPTAWGSFWIYDNGEIRPETPVDGWISINNLTYYAG